MFTRGNTSFPPEGAHTGKNSFIGRFKKCALKEKQNKQNTNKQLNKNRNNQKLKKTPKIGGLQGFAGLITVY